MPRPLTVLAVVLILLALPLVAHAHPGDGRPHVQSFQENRDVRATADGAVVTYELARRSAPLSDSLHFRFDGRTGEIRFELRPDRARPADAYGYTLELDRLVEFRDENGNRRFDGGIDTEVRAYPFRTMSWRSEGPETISVSGADTEYVVATGRFGTTGEFRVQFYGNGRPVDFAEAELHPQDVKMIWNYARFPFTAEDTRFALVLNVVTASGTTVTEELNADDALTALWFRAPGRFAFFDWADHAIGNSTHDHPAQRLVYAQLLDEVTERDDAEVRTLVLSYPQADHLLSHDPVTGMEYTPPPPPPFLGLPVARLLGFGLLVGVAWGAWWGYRHDGVTRVRDAWTRFVDAVRRE